MVPNPKTRRNTQSRTFTGCGTCRSKSFPLKRTDHVSDGVACRQASQGEPTKVIKRASLRADSFSATKRVPNAATVNVLGYLVKATSRDCSGSLMILTVMAPFTNSIVHSARKHTAIHFTLVSLPQPTIFDGRN